MFTELLRQKGTLDDRCSTKVVAPGPLETSVRDFFSSDFVTPVLATGLLFDLPTLLIPQLRLLPDRARTLELAYHQAISPKSETTETQFYSTWSPSGTAPALFFNSTSANYGRPVIVSQLYMADQRPVQLLEQLVAQSMRLFGRRFSTKEEQERADRFRLLIIDGIQANTYTRPNYFNILEYRPDLQMSRATASVLSARFPYVTPPGLLHSDKVYAAADTTLRETTDLQLIDGGFWDNSGISTAIGIMRQLRSANETKELAGNLEFHLISFGHARSALQMEGSRDAQSELFAPITTFEAVRESRRFRSTDAEAAGFQAVHSYELFDHQFQAPLSWTLSSRIRREIEARSGGEVAPSLCCALPEVPIFASMLPDFTLNLEPMKQYLAPGYLSKPEKDGFRLVTPNLRAFRAIIWLVQQTSQNATPTAK